MAESTTIRVTQATKRLLESLTTSWEKATGRPATQQEVAEKAFQYLERNPSQFLKDSTWSPPTKAQWTRFRSFVGHYGDLDTESMDAAIADQVDGRHP